ncbi:MAG: GNAT family N-acetyltransferase [Cellvibrionaceae bacterium]|nr:GNAT family N-acetyltransferase [Cellvibrionaceae bacterium]MCV6627557.1 GNAT family N-acetyltransferase [Cellvibrionaceae bacterium]
MSFEFCELAALQLPLLNRFYKHCRYPAKGGRGDRCFCLRQNGGIVAAVKLSPQTIDGLDYWFLRAMVVEPTKRGEGLGSALLQGLLPVLAERPCYCYPFNHLEGFYAQAGYARMDPAILPQRLQQGLARLQQQGRKVVVMVRP